VFRVVVRSRRDARAVEAALRIFMPGWVVEVETLQGVRGDKLVDAILESAEPFTFILLGREDSDAAERVEGDLPPFSSVIVTRAARVRNNTVEAIYGYLGQARARVRLSAYWDGRRYLLSNGLGGVELPKIPYTLLGDNFFLQGRGARLLSLFLMKNAGDLPLLYKDRAGRHVVYSGSEQVGEIIMEDDSPTPRGKPNRQAKPQKASLDDVLEANKPILEILERHAVEWLRSVAPDPDTVIVPWSGGKDSTAALLVALAAYGRDGVVAVHVDTGIDFPENREYVEEYASKLGVNLVVEEAGVDKGLLEEGMPLPNPDDRWCTGRKLDALRRGFEKAARGKTVIITGDRDAESERRYRRPPVRPDQATGLPVLSPLKLWGGAHTQLYILSKGLRLNTLYEAGFYRIGCYICYSLRSWEINVMKKAGVLDRILARKPGHEKLIELFLDAKRKGLLKAGDVPCMCTV
jgi:3'-phosphoadenosine 5'-phosphosulfate sulfotransferase (PAPS reductase)/FAD synthetase/3'-phosphoadenosine 5'-phosphosulfate sulfotransferase